MLKSIPKKPNDDDEKCLRINGVSELTGLANSTIWSWINTKGFPKPIKLSPRVSVWRRSEVLAWCLEK